MGLFGKPSTKSYLGVDLGAGGIKVAELMNEKGRARLVTYGYADRDFDAMNTNVIDTSKDAANLLRGICQKAKTIPVILFHQSTFLCSVLDLFYFVYSFFLLWSAPVSTQTDC